MNNNAIIDIGSNSIRMLIYRIKDGEIQQVNRSLRYTKLAEDLSKTHKLSEAAIKRNLTAIDEFVGIAKDYDVKSFYLYATSAVRDAENREVFMKEVKDRFGFDIHVISGDKEAEYGYFGVRQAFHGPILVFDIGGASTELVYGDEKLEDAVSLRFGCVRSTEDYFNNLDKAQDSKELFDAVYRRVSQVLETFKLPEDFTLIGIGGTVTTLSSIVQKLEIYDSSKVHKSVLSYEEIKKVFLDLVKKDEKRLKEVVGLPEKRISTILAGTVITLAVIRASGKTKISVCDTDGLEGAAYVQSR